MKRLFCTVAACVLTSIPVCAVEPRTCDEALHVGALPWGVSRRVRELALAHVQVALNLGWSDLGPTRALVTHDSANETFTVWVEVTPPDHATQFIRVVMDADFRIGVAHAKSRPGNEAAQMFADWHKIEARAVQIPGLGGRRRRMASLFVRAAGPVATLEPEAGLDSAPERQIIEIKDLPDTPPRPVVQLPMSQHLRIKSEATTFLTELNPLASQDFKMTRVEAGPGRFARARIETEDEEHRFWVLLDEKNTPLIDLDDEPGAYADFTKMQAAIPEFVLRQRRKAQITGLILMRKGDRVTARVSLFEAISTTIRTYVVTPDGDGFAISAP